MAKYAFVAATGEPALTVIDVTDPTSPFFVTSILTDLLSDFAYLEGVLYAVSFNNRSLTCITADPAPSILGRISGGGAPNFLQNPRQLVPYGNYCYIAIQGDDGLTIIDISNPNNPTYAGGIYGAGAPNFLNDSRALAMLDTSHYCMTSRAEPSFSIIDVSTPAAPVIVGQVINAAYDTQQMQISGTRAYLVNNTNDLTIVNVSDITNPTLIST
ncbi:unnamed protein product, partial [marine sediment metagenome]